MARRIQPIFDAILADPRIQGNERLFVESLLTSYKRKKSLSAGRRRCLLQIEERLKAPPATIEKELATQLLTTEFRAGVAGDDWATNFIGSLRGQLLAGRELSPRQKEILAKIVTRHSEEAQTIRDNWASSFTSEMREKMIIAAHYYLANPPYFGDLARKVIEDDAFVPSKKAYEKMVENKYTTKVIESTLSEPKFAAGSHVALRANAKVQRQGGSFTGYGHPTSDLRAKIGVIIKANAKPVTSPARGSKVYSVLFFGEALPVFVEERWLKKGKR